MLEYFSYKKYKQYKDGRDVEQKGDSNGGKTAAQKGKGRAEGAPERSSTEAGPARPVLNQEDQDFFEELCSNQSGEHVDDDDDDDNGPPPPLPPRIYDWEMDSCSETEGASGTEGPAGGEGEGDRGPSRAKQPQPQPQSAPAPEKPKTAAGARDEKKPSRLSVLFTKPKRQESSLVPPTEAERETKDASRVLDRLNFFVKNNTVLAYSRDSSELLQRFTQIFKDLVNGVPSAYDDLTRLIEDRDGSIGKLFDKLPNSLQRMVTQLPEKLTGTLAPELLTAFAATQGLKVAEGGSLKDTAKNFLRPNSLTDMVRKPGAVVALFRAIVTTLKTRWPAVIGMNVIWSVSLSLLLVMLWYCYKRGRDERLDRERAASDDQRIEELPDDRTVPTIVTSSEPASSGSSRRTKSSRQSGR
ncbi:hypothetical protein ESCO_005162 [Escovopsis weberi]|uniref:Ring-like domain-containing protein n=1 Tax=Escovopsis weberi TaxID=150374 RepID=A0A0M8N697_ESCWE|nr:hypothetical protein ESCO_005162 [Escovopsis weberi]